MVPQSRFLRQPPRHPPGRKRWRAWAAQYALAAFLWPSLGPLPWLIAGFGPGVVASASPATTTHDDVGAAPHEHGDASDVPGSPTHPADHDCPQCQVLAQLARCVLFAPAPPAIPAAPVAPIRPCAVVEPHVAGDAALLPPARAPPARTA